MRSPWLALVLAAMLAITACDLVGGDDDDDENGNGQPEAEGTPDATADPTPSATPPPEAVEAPAPAGLQGVAGLPVIAQGWSMVAAFQALAVEPGGTAVHYRLSLGSNVEDFDSVSITVEYATESLDFAGVSLGVLPELASDLCAGQAACMADDAAGVVNIAALQPLRGRVFGAADDARFQQGEALDYIISFNLAQPTPASGVVVQASVAGRSAAGDDLVGPLGEAFVFQAGDFQIDGSFPSDVPQIADTVSPRVFLTNASGATFQNVTMTYIMARPPGLEFLTGSCNTREQATLAYEDLPTIASLPDLEFCFTNSTFSSGRQLQLEASFKAAAGTALSGQVRILLAARGKDANGVIHLSELQQIAREV
ncbi:MAG: hypothetical protein GEU28_02320 [Dehalococcoidia bacterium]|nr:hypothetical protein [Dehalococcoidia bacterium]